MIMKRGLSAYFLVLVLSLFSAQFASANDHAVPPDISIEAILSETRFFLAEPFQLTVKVSWSGEHGEILVDPPAKVPLEGLDLLSTSSSNRTVFDGDRRIIVREYRYSLRPVREGAATIGSLSVAVHQRPANSSKDNSDTAPAPLATLSTSPLTLTIEAPPPPLRIPWHTVLSILGLLLFVGVFIAFLRYKRRVERPRDSESTLSPRQKLATTVESIESLLFSGEIKQYYADFEKAFHLFIRETSGVAEAAHENALSTINDIVTRTEVLPEEDVVTVKHWLEVNDLVKFGGHQPSEEDARRQIRALMRIAATIENKLTT